MSARIYATREAWLLAAVEELRPRFRAEGVGIPALKVSVGWPGGRGVKNVIGQCWPTTYAADGEVQIFVSPVLSDVVEILAVLTHELVHAALDCEGGHKGEFARISKAVGLVAPMTQSIPGDDLREALVGIADGLGEFPHAALGAPATAEGEEEKRPGSRMIKAECAHGSGYKVRLARRWIEEVGPPWCPCHGEPMEVEG